MSTMNTTRARNLSALLRAAAQELRDQGRPDDAAELLEADPREMLNAADAVFETMDAINALRHPGRA